ncbi:hypothetical protein ASD42_32005 [Nocardia sp. Root136]|nr:hypothetical protein ASD42_32005 [Nocardia sp. Root136]
MYIVRTATDGRIPPVHRFSRGQLERDEVVTLTEPMEGDRWCRNVDALFPKKSFVWSAISHTDAHYVFAAIYVNGKLVARDEDRSTYGYGSAQAM